MASERKSSKAQARFISYVLTILFSVLFLSSIVMLFYTFYNIALQNEIRESLRQLTIQTSDSVIRIYENSKDVHASPGNYSDVLLYEDEITFPKKVSNRNYEILLVTANPSWLSIVNITVGNKTVYPVVSTSGAKVIARTTQDPKTSVEYDIPNINAIVEGKTDGDNTKIRYYRNNINGTIYDIIALGDQGVLLRITNVG